MRIFFASYTFILCIYYINGESRQTYLERCLTASAKKENSIPDSEKQVCIVTAYDKIRGFLNWSQVRFYSSMFFYDLVQDWFKKAAAANCNTKIILEEKKTVCLKLGRSSS